MNVVHFYLQLLESCSVLVLSVYYCFPHWNESGFGIKVSSSESYQTWYNTSDTWHIHEISYDPYHILFSLIGSYAFFPLVFQLRHASSGRHQISFPRSDQLIRHTHIHLSWATLVLLHCKTITFYITSYRDGHCFSLLVLVWFHFKFKDQRFSVPYTVTHTLKCNTKSLQRL